MSTHHHCVLALCTILLTACATKNENVKEVERLEADVSGQGLDVKKKRVRAWVEGIERDVSAATLIQRLSEDQHVQGMTISYEGTQLVFSLLEHRSVKKNSEESARSDAETKQGSTASEELKTTFATLRSLRIGSGGITQITTGNWHDFFPSFGPASSITFSSNRLRRGGSDIFRISAERVGGVSVIHQAPEAFSFYPSVAKDGVTAYSYTPLFSQGEPSQIWAMGGPMAYPVQLREGSTPSVSPDGSEIAFIGDDGQLWVVPVTGQNPTQLTLTDIPKDKDKISLPKQFPSWSADGKHIVFAAADGKDGDDVPNYDIWIIPRTGGNAQQLTTNGSLDIYPVVSPAQDFIYLVSNRGFKEGIWRIPYPFKSAPPVITSVATPPAITPVAAPPAPPPPEPVTAPVPPPRKKK